MKTKTLSLLHISMLILIALLIGTFFVSCGNDDDDDGNLPTDNSGIPYADDDDDDDMVDDDDDTTDDDDDVVDDDDDVVDDDDDTTVTCDFSLHDPLIIAGKQHLEAGEIYEGYESFADALALCPESFDANIGIALAEQLELERKVYAFLEYVLTNPQTPKEKGFVSMMQSILKNDMLPKAKQMQHHAQAIRYAPDNWSFYIGTYPFIVEGEFEDRVLMDLGGEWDHADAIQLEAESYFYQGMLHLICAYDFPINYGWLTTFPTLTGTFTEKIHAICGWLLGVLDDPAYTETLTLYPNGEGEEELHQGGLAMGWFFVLMYEASQKMLTETDDQADDLTGYEDRNGNFQWDPGEPYKVPYAGYLNDAQNELWAGMMATFQSAGYSTWNKSELDLHPLAPDWFLLSELNWLPVGLGFQPWIPPIPVDLGAFWYDQDADEVKMTIRAIIQTIFDATAP